ncbi:hypothetical protein GCM10020369_25110 [Cryptosporangium minutisporangium]|uniref:Uncharacterized protein n=2 Tax=Cryptosporangium minutisporangium TaxID=113569 RepID=A0ABP6SWF2_9ACTN
MLATNRGTVYIDAETDLPPESVPISPADLAAHVHDLLAARGLNPPTSAEAISGAEYGAAILLAAYGALALPGRGSQDAST